MGHFDALPILIAFKLGIYGRGDKDGILSKTPVQIIYSSFQGFCFLLLEIIIKKIKLKGLLFAYKVDGSNTNRPNGFVKSSP